MKSPSQLKEMRKTLLKISKDAKEISARLANFALDDKSAKLAKEGLQHVHLGMGHLFRAIAQSAESPRKAKEEGDEND